MLPSLSLLQLHIIHYTSALSKEEDFFVKCKALLSICYLQLITSMFKMSHLYYFKSYRIFQINYYNFIILI